jgi:hypothetical protein
MPTKTYSPAEDRAFFLAIIGLPVLRIASALLFLQLQKHPSRDQIVALIRTLGT